MKALAVRPQLEGAPAQKLAGSALWDAKSSSMSAAALSGLALRGGLGSTKLSSSELVPAAANESFLAIVKPGAQGDCEEPLCLQMLGSLPLGLLRGQTIA